MSKVLLGVTGSVAAKLTSKMVKAIQQAGHEVQVVMTEAAGYFFDKDALKENLKVPVWTQQDEFPGNRYDPDKEILHIALRDWAEIFVIAPLSADTLGDLSIGKCNKLLTSIARAWIKTRPLIIAPAMNTHMWTDPITAEQIEALDKRFILLVVEPVSKALACGDVGMGAMNDISVIVDEIDIASNFKSK